MLAIIASLLAAASPAAAARSPDEAALVRAIGDRVAGKPVDCIPISVGAVDSTQVIDGTAIVYRVYGRLYVNRPTSGASALRRDDILVTQVVTDRLCRIDTVSLRDAISPIPHGVVTLGDFVPYDRSKR